MKYRGVLTIFICVLMPALAIVSCDSSRQDPYLQDLLETEPNAEELPDDRIAELRRSVNDFKEEVEQRVRATGNLGHYYRLLASEYMNRRMYGPAIDALEEALRIEADNEILYYRMGVAAARQAKAVFDEEERQSLFRRSEQAYRRSITLDPGYVDALYGLSVLYVFELDRPADAEPHLERLLAEEPRRTDARFLLARVYVATGRISDAVEIYGEIVETTSDEEQRRRALENQRSLLGGSQ